MNYEPITMNCKPQYAGDWRNWLSGPTGKYYYLHDRLGSVRLLIDENAYVKNRYTYQPFGELFDSESWEDISNPFKFTGQWYDSESGDYWLRARIYSPRIYRFTSRDLIWGKLQEPLSLHKYLYCYNDPINYVDPTGLFSMVFFDPDGKSGDWRFGVAAREIGSQLEKAGEMVILVPMVSLKHMLTEIETSVGFYDDEPLKHVYVLDHSVELPDYRGGTYRRQQVGDDLLYARGRAWQKFGKSGIGAGANFHFLGCSLAASDEGKSYIQELASYGRVIADAFDEEVRYNLFKKDTERWSGGQLWRAFPGGDGPIPVSAGTLLPQSKVQR